MQTFLGISRTYFIGTTSIHGCTIVHVGTLMTCCWFFYSQYQLFFSCIQLIYCALTTRSSAELIFPSHVVSSCKVNASETNLITYYPAVGVFVLFMATYLPGCTNEAILSLIPCGFVCGKKNNNDGNWFVLKNILISCAQYQHPPEHGTPSLSTLFFLLFSFIYLVQSIHVCVPHQTDCFEILWPN